MTTPPLRISKIPRRGLVDRRVNVRDSWLCVIATEGTNTEKQYFEGLFQSTRVVLRVLETRPDDGSAPQHVLARLLAFEQSYDLGPEDQLWLVADVDRWQPSELRDVYRVARQKRLHVAISNPCFELWLWMHFGDADPADTDGKALMRRLRGHLGAYNKTNLDLGAYRDHVTDAVRRARDLDRSPRQSWPAFPGTHVYRLVGNLLETLPPSPGGG